MLACAALAASGCSQERSRAVTEPAGANERDYRGMIERSRARQNSQDSLQSLRDAIRHFQQDIGRLPTNVAELIVRRYVKAMPQLPPDQQFVYDPVLGVVGIQNVAPPDTLSPTLPPAPELTNRPTLAPQP